MAEGDGYDIFPITSENSIIEDTINPTNNIRVNYHSHHEKRKRTTSSSFDHGKTRTTAAQLQKQLAKSECVFHLQVHDILPVGWTSSSTEKGTPNARRERVELFTYTIEALEHYVDGIYDTNSGCVHFAIPAESLGMQFYVALTIRGKNSETREKLKCRVPLHGLSCGIPIIRLHSAYDGTFGIPYRTVRIESELKVRNESLRKDMKVPPLVCLHDILPNNAINMRYHFYGEKHPSTTTPLANRENIQSVYTGVGSVTEVPGKAVELQMTDAGALLLTTYRLMFVPQTTGKRRRSLHYTDRSIDIPIGIIDKISLRHTNDLERPCNGMDGWLLDIACTNARSHLFFLGGQRGGVGSISGGGSGCGCSSGSGSGGCCRSMCESPEMKQSNKYYFMMLEDLITEVRWLRLEQPSLATTNGILWTATNNEEEGKEKDKEEKGKEEKYKEEGEEEKSPLTWSLRLSSNADSPLKYEFEKRQSSIMSSGRWRATNINEEYQVCPSYPSYLVVPSSVDDKTIIKAAKHRSRRRLPALSWYNPLTGASISRSSQPQVGLGGKTSKDDEILLYAFCQSADETNEATTMIDVTKDMDTFRNKETEEFHDIQKAMKRSTNNVEQGEESLEAIDDTDNNNNNNNNNINNNNNNNKGEDTTATTTAAAAAAASDTTTTTTATTTTNTATTTNSNKKSETKTSTKDVDVKVEESDVKLTEESPVQPETVFSINRNRLSSFSRNQWSKVANSISKFRSSKRKTFTLKSKASYLDLKSVVSHTLSQKNKRKSEIKEHKLTSFQEKDELVCHFTFNDDGLVQTAFINTVKFDKTDQNIVGDEMNGSIHKESKNVVNLSDLHDNDGNPLNVHHQRNTTADTNMTIFSTATSSSSASKSNRKLKRRHTRDASLIIADARPKLNAVANKFKGKGYENTASYRDKHIALIFMGIANIHVMRNSQKKVTSSLENGNWEASLINSKWLHHIKLVVSSACRVAANITSGQSVLVHCSDGKIFNVLTVLDFKIVDNVF
jgi:hypothetical protein